jgi:hypothetical protein
LNFNSENKRDMKHFSATFSAMFVPFLAFQIVFDTPFCMESGTNENMLLGHRIWTREKLFSQNYAQPSERQGVIVHAAFTLAAHFKSCSDESDIVHCPCKSEVTRKPVSTAARWAGLTMGHYIEVTLVFIRASPNLTSGISLL